MKGKDLRRRIATVLLIAISILALTASPVMAKSMSMYKQSGRAVQTFWIQVDGTPTGSQFGNVHVGDLYAFQVSTGKADAFGFIDDFDCEPGKLPNGGGHGIDEGEEPSGCVFVGSRYAEAYGLSLTLDRKMTTANLKGQMKVYGGGHGDGGLVGRPNANITWTGTGPLFKQRSTWSWTDGRTTYTDRYRSTDRSAVMSGTLGPMGFDPALSGGFMSDFSMMSKSRTR